MRGGPGGATAPRSSGGLGLSPAAGAGAGLGLQGNVLIPTRACPGCFNLTPLFALGPGPGVCVCFIGGRHLRHGNANEELIGSNRNNVRAFLFFCDFLLLILP